MARLVVVQTEIDIPQDGVVFQHPEYWQAGGPAAGHIVVLPPVFWVERDVGEQIDRSLKHIEPVTETSPMEAAPWVAALCIDAEGLSSVVCTALVGMTDNAVFILPDEHGVVVFFMDRRCRLLRLGSIFGSSVQIQAWVKKCARSCSERTGTAYFRNANW